MILVGTSLFLDGASPANMAVPQTDGPGFRLDADVVRRELIGAGQLQLLELSSLRLSITGRPERRRLCFAHDDQRLGQIDHCLHASTIQRPEGAQYPLLVIGQREFAELQIGELVAGMVWIGHRHLAATGGEPFQAHRSDHGDLDLILHGRPHAIGAFPLSHGAPLYANRLGELGLRDPGVAARKPNPIVYRRH